MRHVKLRDLEVSRIGLGAMGMSHGYTGAGSDDAESIRTIHWALELGVTLIDTAEIYGPYVNEELVGRALKGHRDQAVIATKFGLVSHAGAGPWKLDSTPANIRAAVQGSLQRLGTDYIDLYYQHRVDPNTPIEDTVGALAELVAEGKIRHVGVSNYGPAEMESLRRFTAVETLQPPYHLFRREIEADVLPYCTAHGMGVLVYGPLAHGLLSGSMTAHTTFAADDWRSQSADFSGETFARNLAVVEELERFATDRGLSLVELAVAWTLSHPAVDVAIVGARRPAQLEGSVRAADVKLTDEDRVEIDRIMGPAAPVHGPNPEGM